MNGREEKITAAEVSEGAGGTFWVGIEQTWQAHEALYQAAEECGWGDSPRLHGLTQEEAGERAEVINRTFGNLFRRTS